MNFMGFLASIIVSADCAGKAAGNIPQVMFADSALWLWWVAAAGWFMTAFKFAAQWFRGEVQ